QTTVGAALRTQPKQRCSAETTVQCNKLRPNNGGAPRPLCVRSGLGAPPLFRRGCLVRSVTGRLLDSRLPACGIRCLLPAQLSRGGHGPTGGEQAGTAAEERQGAVRSGPRQLTAVRAAGSTAAARAAAARTGIAATTRTAIRAATARTGIRAATARTGITATARAAARARIGA